MRAASRPNATLADVAAIINEGGVCVFPTESFYALGARPDRSVALDRISDLKSRQADKPLGLIADSTQTVAAFAHLTGPAKILAEAFWPGPLTLALRPLAADCHPALLAADGTVGIRVSAWEKAEALATACGGLITATSANLRGEDPSQSIEGLPQALLSAVDVLWDLGPTPGGKVSTVVTFSAAGDPVIVRPGAVSQTQIAASMAS